MAPDNRIAVCPGSYDPVTNGHLDIISRASGMFDKIIVAVVNLPMRKGGTLFTGGERVSFIKNATSHLGNIEVEPFSVLTVDFARSHGAKAIVRGLRAISSPCT
jgi:pantetheine-phosphate adenylyltransferase